MSNIKSKVANAANSNHQFAEARESGFDTDFSNNGWESGPYTNGQFASKWMFKN